MLSLPGHVSLSINFPLCDAAHSTVPSPAWHSGFSRSSVVPLFSSLVYRGRLNLFSSGTPLSDILTSDSTIGGFLYLIEWMWRRTVERRPLKIAWKGVTQRSMEERLEHECRLSGSFDFSLPISDFILDLQSTPENSYCNSRYKVRKFCLSSILIPVKFLWRSLRWHGN